MMIDALRVTGSTDHCRLFLSGEGLVGGAPRPLSSPDSRGDIRGPWYDLPQLCEYGLRRPPKSNLASPVRADQVETAIEFLRMFRPIKKGSYCSYYLKHEAESWGHRNGMCNYVSNGALLWAALHLGLTVDEYWDRYPTSPNAKIGISRRDFNVFKRAQGRRHVG